MVKCVFCGREEKEFIGVHLFKNDGNIEYYCSHKCRMNARKLHRDKRRVRWTEAFHIARHEAMEKKKAQEAKAAGKSEKAEEVSEKKVKGKKK